jgi:hypothetical protein
MNIHIQPTQAVCRVYFGEGSYERKSTYDAVFTITFLCDNTAYFQAAHGKTNLKAYQLIIDKLKKEYNVETVIMERHGRVVRYPVNKLKIPEE